ncbi:MAG: hypothetical protein WCE70_00085 [Rhodanobacteraceae bacterium]
MNMPWHEWAGLIGVALVLFAFLLLQAHKLHGNGPTYQAMNALGAFGVMLSLLFGNFNLAAFLLEIAWLLISIYGMAVGLRRRRAAREEVR